MPTSPYDYNTVASLHSALARANTGYYGADKFMKAHYNSVTSGTRNRYLAQQQAATRNYNAALKSWMAAGRPGAMAALQAKFPTQDAVLSKILPFDEQSALDRINTKRTYDQNIIGIGSQRNQINQDYATQKHVYDQNVPIMARQLLNNYGARGMANSSGYGQAVGQQNADLANQLAGLDASKQVGLANLSSQEGQVNAGYQNDLASIMYNAVQNLSTKAGTLGLKANKGIDIFQDPTLLIKLAQKMLTGG